MISSVVFQEVPKMSVTSRFNYLISRPISFQLFHAVSMLEHEIWYECDAYGRSPTQDESEVLLKCYLILGGFYE